MFTVGCGILELKRVGITPNQVCSGPELVDEMSGERIAPRLRHMHKNHIVGLDEHVSQPGRSWLALLLRRSGVSRSSCGDSSDA